MDSVDSILDFFGGNGSRESRSYCTLRTDYIGLRESLSDCAQRLSLHCAFVQDATKQDVNQWSRAPEG